MSAAVDLAPFGPTPPPSRAVRKRVAQLLAAGELVALPTETVYGLFARADRRESIARLRAAKRRPEEKVFTWHVGDAAALDGFPRLWHSARRLAAKYWPGPLTLVLPGVPPGLEHASADGWTGVRLPAFAPTAKLLAELDFPVIGSSANRHGAPPLVEPAAIAAEFASEVALVADGGTPPLKEGSVVLKLGPGSFELLRPGIIDLEALRRVAGLRIGFVCTGNTCRSPMAEVLARDVLARRLGIAPERVREFGFECISMGVFAQAGAPASREALAVMAASGLDLSDHRSTPLDADEIARLDRVYALTRGHLEALRAAVSSTTAKRCELLDPEGRDIADPIGGTREDYEHCAAAIRAALEVRADAWV
ncbi:MAG: Sua5/YciO/YrdC/YwlC family protein [Planctomycetes bacterium]|nr:Sua5/YciO/YrdC/YwlC family protein [Planctomycetota bacterium]